MKKIFYILLALVTILSLLLFFFNTQIIRIVSQIPGHISGATCSMRGGIVKTHCNAARCRKYCIIPYRDGGQTCTHSDQCTHRCITQDKRLPGLFPTKKTMNPQCTQIPNGAYNCTALNLTGTCQEQEFANCTTHWELRDGFVSRAHAHCRAG